MKRTKVKNLAKQIRGVSYKPEDLHDSLDEDSVILLRANNIDDGKINFDDVVYVDKSKVSDEHYLKVGDVLICASSGSKQLVGKAASVVFDSPCTFGAFCKVVRPNTNVADYLGKYFQSGVYRRKISEVAIGANINNIRNEHIDSLELPIYEPAQAQRIVEKIGLLQNIIDNRKCELSKLDELIKARFVEMFGDPETNPKDWIKRPLADVITTANNGMARRGNDEDGNIVMRLVELQDGYIDYSNPNRIVLTEAEKKRYLLKDKDFLFARVNGNPDNVGRCAVFYDIGEPVFHNDHIIRVHFNDDALEGAFASALLNSEYGKRQLKNQIKTSAGQYTVSQDGIGAIVTILPPIEIQRQFAAFVAQVDKSKVAVHKALDEAQLLFDSVMQDYFE